MPGKEGREKRRMVEGWEDYTNVGERYATGVPFPKFRISLSPQDRVPKEFAGEVSSKEGASGKAKAQKRKLKK